MGKPNPPDDQPDSSLVWSTEDDKKIEALLIRHNGDLDASLKSLFGSSCSAETAVIVSERYAKHFGLTHVQFMEKYRKWKRGEL